MGLDMWFKDDIRNVLYGLSLATPRMGADYPDGGQAFRDGYAAALEAVAVSFGIAAAPRTQARQPQLRDVTPRPRQLTNGRTG